MPWTCPACARSFGRRNQSHQCEPAMSLDDFLAEQPEERRASYRAVLAVLEGTGEVEIDPVEVGILVKRARTFCELRPRRGAVELSFKLSRPVASGRIRKRITLSANRLAFFVDLASEGDVDEEIREWLAEAWLASPA